MNSSQLKALGWMMWVISAQCAAWMFATGFSFWILWAMINFMFLADRLWVGAARTKIEEQQWKESNDRTAEEPSGD